MRFRKLSAAAAIAALALGALVGCTSKIGQAAVVGNHRISDANVEHYLTSRAEPFQIQSQSGPATIVPRSYVLQALIYQQLFSRALADTKGGTPSAAELADADQAISQGQTKSQQQAQYTKYGFEPSFAALDLRNSSMEAILAQRLGATNDAGPILTEIAKLKVPISVSGRYGSWDAKDLALSSDPSAGLPSFVTFSTAAAGAAAALPTS